MCIATVAKAPGEQRPTSKRAVAKKEVVTKHEKSEQEPHV